MTVYVDALGLNGWQLHGRPVQSCHMFCDGEDHEELHAIAQTIGLKRAWLRSGGGRPHYHLTPGKRVLAIAAGAVPVGRSLAVRIWRTQQTRIRENRP
ncbi:DUF4031 domain-containing protein [Azoarcus olearius]|uniref:DUF4031 domain-containing protein n=1 Tax=Azoarcus sp. (strain BH72) TaxID=418699 RepID=UPI00059F82D2|nr:DUF4031 domain-containing protein [Azoarcus olearius]